MTYPCSADLDPQSEQILSTQGPLPQADSDEMVNDLMNYLLRVGSIGLELTAVAPFREDATLLQEAPHGGHIGSCLVS
jgi:hypothetical protein